MISVQDIAERSTVNRGTFYDHFTDKFALLEAMMGERFTALITARMEQGAPNCEAALRQLILAACDFLAEVTSGCQKHQRQFEPPEPLVESQMKAVMRRTLLPALRAHGMEKPEIKATMVTRAIAGAALEWSRKKKPSAEAFADSILPMAHAPWNERNERMQIGVDSFVTTLTDPRDRGRAIAGSTTGKSPRRSVLADQVGLDHPARRKRVVI